MFCFKPIYTKLSCKKLPPSLAENLKDTSGEEKKKKRKKRQFSFTQGIGWVWGLSRASEGSKTRQPVLKPEQSESRINAVEIVVFVRV